MTHWSKIAASLMVGLALFSLPTARAESPVPLSGSIAGVVKDATGVPQMGASVYLFNRSERLIQRAITNERGLFGFAALTPDLYSLRVSLASFVPAVRQKIAVQPGMQSLLYVNLASVLSSIELVYALPGQGALMSDDWKWTLKASSSTRPVLRMLPGTSASDPSQRVPATGGLFSDTRGVVNVSAGDPGSLGGASSGSDLGTAFALSTSLLGRNQLQVRQCRLQLGLRNPHRRLPHKLQPGRVRSRSSRHHAADLSAGPRQPGDAEWANRRRAGTPYHVSIDA